MSRYAFNPSTPLNFYLIKDKLLKQLGTSEKKIVWIWGESGIGKSLFASVFYDDQPDQKIWLDMKEDKSNFDELLQKINQHIRQDVRLHSKPLWIFIDDAQKTADLIAEFCTSVIEHCSDQIRLCVISRNAPGKNQLPLIKADQIEELPPALLRFTLNETIAFCEQQGKPINDELIQIHQQYDGLPLAIASNLLAAKDSHALLPEAVFLRSAQWEEAAGNTLSALALYVKAKRLDQFSKLFLCNARHWFASGQREKIGDVLSLITDKEKDAYPWCWVWESLLELPTNPDLARRLAEHAFKLFKQNNDINGMYLSISQAVLTYLVKLSDFNDIRRLLHELSKFDTDVNYTALDNHAKASVSYVIYFCMFLVMPENKRLARWEERTLSVLVSETEIVPRLKMQVLVQKAYLYRGDNYKIHPLETLIEVGNDTPVQPYDIINFNLAKIQENWCLGKFEEIKEIYQESREVTIANNMQANIAHTSLQVVIALLLNNELEEARTEIYQLLDSIPRRMSALLHHLYALEAWRQTLLKEHALAINTARQCTTISHESGCTAYIGFSYIVEAYTFALAGEFEQAYEKLDQLKQQKHYGHYEIFDFHADLLNAYLAFAAGDESLATEYATQALSFATRKHLFYFIWSVPQALSLSVSLSLKAGHQTDFCNKLIETLNLSPPQHARSENCWYWPVTIKTLGGLHTNIEALNKPGKSRRIQLLIIYLAIVYGETGVPLDILYDTLWPDEDPSSARPKLDNALYRLRQVLGKQSLSIVNTHVKLANSGIWVDVIYLQDLIRQCRKALQNGADPEYTQAKILEIIALYRGEFLEGMIAPNHEIASFRVKLFNQVSSLLKSAYHQLENRPEAQHTLDNIRNHLIFIENLVEADQAWI